MRLRAEALILLLTLTGCAADLGGGPGVELKTGHAVGIGRLAVSTRSGPPLNDHGVLVGAALENRAEEAYGSRWLGGFIIGGGFGPASLGSSRVGFDGYLEIGTPLRSSIFRGGDHYLGVGFDLPIRTSEERSIQKLNESTWIALRRIEILPFVRTRVHDDFRAGDLVQRIEISGGLALRARVFTDVF